MKSPEFKRKARYTFLAGGAGFMLTLATMLILPQLSAEIAEATMEHALLITLAILPPIPVWLILVPYLLQVRIIQKMARDKVSTIDIE